MMEQKFIKILSVNIEFLENTGLKFAFIKLNLLLRHLIILL
jgi:hypothetical protein